MLKLKSIKSNKQKKKFRTDSLFALAYKNGEICEGVAIMDKMALVFISERWAEIELASMDPHFAEMLEVVKCKLMTEVSDNVQKL